MEVQAACKLGLLEVRGNVLVRHLLHAGLEKVVLLDNVSCILHELVE